MAKPKTQGPLSLTVNSLAGKPVALSKYLGNVVLIVNVASECGLTPQYQALQGLHEKLGKKGLRVLGFPCNQFGAQEPGSAKEIQGFCTKNYGVEFDMFEKVEVNGPGAAPLFQNLTGTEAPPKGKGPVTWNFEKFLLDKQGALVARFDPRTKPDDPTVLARIEAELAKN